MGTLNEGLNDEIDSSAIQDITPRAGIAAVVVVAALAAGIALVMYRRRRRRSLMKRLQDALPEMEDILASLKRPVERAVKVL
jgi:Flp pilus assembly protein TadB